MIIYKIDVLNELKKHGYNTYKIKKEKIFNQTQMQKMRNGEKITFETLNKLCELTELQPGDILEYRKEIFGYKSTKYFPKTPKTNVITKIIIVLAFTKLFLKVLIIIKSVDDKNNIGTLFLNKIG